ncbi:MAG: Do family serine endopeptidase [bacterium]|nr:Do family serine endopeptidase [bacterium]
MKKILSIFTIAALGALFGVGINHLITNYNHPSSFEAMQKNNARFASTFSSKEASVGFDFVKVAETSTPAVVHIKSYYEAEKPSAKKEQNGQMDPFEFFKDHGFDFDMPRGPGIATGSGVIITQDGYIVTNNHVIDKASKIEITMNDKRTYLAELIGTDKTTDLALLKIDEKNLNFMSFGNSDQVKVGEWVAAVGNPMNLTSTVTAGIVSAKGRSIDLLRSQDNQYAIENFIQTDAAINPGNSGGALVSTNGQLIGINTAIASQTGSYTGYGFAIPVNLVKKVMDDLLKFGKVQRAVLGVAILEISQELAEKEGLKELKGVLVQEVSENGSAGKAGVKKGDVIDKVNGVEVNSVSGLQEEIGKFRPGDKVSLTINRKGDVKEIIAVLKGLDGKETPSVADKSEINTIKGATFSTLSKDEKDKLGIKNGIKIQSVGSGPFKGKLPVGFVITKIDKQSVYSIQNLKSILENTEGAILIEGKNPDGTDNVVGLKIEK